MTPQQFADKLIEAGLLNSEQVKACCESTGLTLQSIAAETLAKKLVKDGCLTLFQAQMAINGKTSSLVLGSYVILEKLGQGGMGQVFKARHRTMKREVALKVISPSVLKDDVSLRRFQREVEAAAKLNHPNIVTAHDAGEHKGTHFLVMELVRGSDLSSVIKKSGPMRASKAVECVLQAARGLAYAHSHGIVHRDIKPANLLLDESGSIKILDMGLARFEDAAADHASAAALTGTGMLMGTIDYMSPEQAMDSKTADARSDIYSLGCTLYFLLTGKAVYDEDTVMKRLMAHQSAAIPKLPLPDEALQKIFERSIAKKAEQRYQATAELVNELQSWLASNQQAAFLPTAEMPIVEESSFSIPDHVALKGEPVEPRVQTLQPPSEPSNDTTPSSAATAQTFVPRTRKTANDKPGPGKKAEGRNSSGGEQSNVRSSLDGPRRSATATNRPRSLMEARRPPAQPPWKRWLLFGGGGAAAFLLLSIIVIKLTNKDGKETIVKVPEGTEISVDPGGDGKVEITRVPEEQNASKATTEPLAKPSIPGPSVASKIAIDLTPAKPLGSWEMGPEPEWFREGGHNNPYLLKESAVLPGLIDRPAALPGIKRWNVDTFGARGAFSVVKYSPDGKWIATGSHDGHVRIFDSQTLALQRLIPGRAFQYGVLALSWHPGSERLAIAADQVAALRVIGRDGTIHFESIFMEDGNNRLAVHGLEWNHAGTQIAVGNSSVHEGRTTAIEIRDDQGKFVRNLELPGATTETGVTSGLTWSPDDRFVAASHSDGKVRIWNVSQGTAAELCEIPRGHMFLQQIAWSKDDWISVSTSQETRLYDPQRQLVRKLNATSGQAVWSPDGKSIVTMTHGGGTIWERDTGRQIAPAEGATYVDFGTVGIVGDWSPDGRQIVVAGDGLAVWDAGLRAVQKRLAAFGAVPQRSDWSPDGRWLAVNQCGIVFDEQGRQQPFQIVNDQFKRKRRSTLGRSEICWRPDAKQLAVGPLITDRDDLTAESRTWLVNVDGNATAIHDATIHSTLEYPQCWSPDGEYLIVSQVKGILTVLDSAGNVVKAIETGSNDEHNPPYARWSLSANKVAVLENGQPLRFLDPAENWSLKPVSEKRLNIDLGTPPVWNADGTVLSACDSWFNSDGSTVSRPDPTHLCDWSPDGAKWLAVGELIVVNTKTGLAERRRTANNNYQMSCSWHPRGNLIAQTTFQSTVTVWRESDLQPHWHSVLFANGSTATFSAAGQLLNDKPESLDPFLVYCIDRGDGRIETLTPSEFRKIVPDSSLIAPSAEVTSLTPTNAPSLQPVPASSTPPLVSAPTAVITPAGTLATAELRMAEGDSNRPKFKESIRPGEPLGDFAAVSRPGKTEGVVSWSIEPVQHRDSIASQAVSSQNLIATGGYDCLIRLWTSDWQLLKVLPGHSNVVASVSFSPDGKRLASVSPSPRAFVVMWDVASGQLLWSKPTSNWYGRLSWSPDGSRLAACENNGLLIFLDPISGEKLGEHKTADNPLAASWSTDGQRIGVLDVAGNFIVIDNASLQVIQDRIPMGQPGHLAGDIHWSPDGRWLAVTSADAPRIFDTATLDEKRRVEFTAKRVEFSPDSVHLAMSNDNTTVVVRTSDWSEVWRKDHGPREVHWSKDGSWLVSGSDRLNATNGSVERSGLVVSHERAIASATADGTRLATINRNRLRIWNGDDGTLISEFQLANPNPDTRQLLWNSDGTRLLRLGILDADGTVGAEVIDPKNGNLLHVLKGHSGPVWRISWSPTGSTAATAGEDGKCILWNTDTGEQIRTLSQTEPQWWLEWSANGKLLATASRVTLTVWDADSGEQKRSFKTLTAPLERPYAAADIAPFSFMKDPIQLTVLGKGGSFDLLNVSTGQISPLGSVLAEGSGGGGRITATWSPDFKLLSSATGYRECELFQPGSSEGKAIRFFSEARWLGDSRRLLGGDNTQSYITGFDTKPFRRIGVLLPELPGGDYIAIGPDGNYSGSPNCADQVVVVALHANGSLKAHRLDEFSKAFDCQNDPAKVRLLKIGK